MPKQPLSWRPDDDLKLGALWKELKGGQEKDPRLLAVWKELDGRKWGWTWEEFVAFIEEHGQWKKEEHDLLVSTCNGIMAEKAAERMRRSRRWRSTRPLTPNQQTV